MTPHIAPGGIQIVPVQGFPEVHPGDDLVSLLAEAMKHSGLVLATGDVVIFTHKIISKAEGRLVRLDSVTPSTAAIQWAQDWNKDARVIEIVLQEATRIVRMTTGVLIAETRHGFVCANAGVDVSNVVPGWAACLPIDPDASAQRLRAALQRRWQVNVGIVISDTFGRPWREGQTNIAVGVAGFMPINDYQGTEDTHGRMLSASAIAVADELAAAAELVMGKVRRVPVALIRGVHLTQTAMQGSARDLVRPRDADLFT